VDKDERGLFEAMLHRLQVIRQETEQQTAILRQLCQAMDGLGNEIGRMVNALDRADLPVAPKGRELPAGAGRGR
jgi:hypothetical protein